jgi:hypothetical protein
LQQESEIILLGGSTGTRLAPSKPSFGRKMLEKGDQAATPIVVAAVGRQGTGDRPAPSLMIGEAGVLAAYLAKRSCFAAFIRNNGLAIGDKRFRSIFSKLGACGGLLIKLSLTLKLAWAKG